MRVKYATLWLHLRGEFFVFQIKSTMMRIMRTIPTSPPIPPPAIAPADTLGVGVSDGSWVGVGDDAAVKSERH